MTMPRCCSGGCDCNIQAGAGITVTGTGSIDDPFVVTAGVVADPAEFPSATVVMSPPATGTADTPPVNPEGYLRVVINGDERYIPFY